MNKVMIVGRTTKDISLKTTQNGTSKVDFSIADTRRKNGNDEVQKYWNIVAWDGTAETLAKYCHKGDQLFIYGTVRDRDYTDKDGIFKTITEVTVETFVFGAKKQTQNQQTEPDPVADALKPVMSEDELPF